MQTYYNKEICIEVGVDEAGRGPLFGRIYTGAVIWPRDLTTDLVKDSKKYTSEKKREEVYEFVKQNAIAYGISYVEAEDIDKINILNADMRAMHQAIANTYINPDYIIVDGNSFTPYMDINEHCPSFTTIEKGDNKYYSIAAGSILAKVEHDRYIVDMCNKYPILKEYGLLHNKGYGTKDHLDMISTRGYTQFHRKTFGICKTAKFAPV